MVDLVERVLIDHRIMGGAPCVRGTRIPVVTILGLLGDGLTPADVMPYYPQLVHQKILGCLQYAAVALDETSPAAAAGGPAGHCSDTD